MGPLDAAAADRDRTIDMTALFQISVSLMHRRISASFHKVLEDRTILRMRLESKGNSCVNVPDGPVVFVRSDGESIVVALKKKY